MDKIFQVGPHIEMDDFKSNSTCEDGEVRPDMQPQNEQDAEQESLMDGNEARSNDTRRKRLRFRILLAAIALLVGAAISTVVMIVMILSGHVG